MIRPAGLLAGVLLLAAAADCAAAELAKILKGDPELLIVGVGAKPCLTLAKDAHALLKKRGVRLKALPNVEAVKCYVAEKGRKALLLHLGC